MTPSGGRDRSSEVARNHVRTGRSDQRHFEQRAVGAVGDEQCLARRADRYAVDPRIGCVIRQRHDVAAQRCDLLDCVDVLLRHVERRPGDEANPKSAEQLFRQPLEVPLPRAVEASQFGDLEEMRG